MLKTDYCHASAFAVTLSYQYYIMHKKPRRMAGVNICVKNRNILHCLQHIVHATNGISTFIESFLLFFR